jgi:hypothetical protein
VNLKTSHRHFAKSATCYSLDVKKETSTIIFNAFDLNLGEVTLRSDAISNGASQNAESIDLFPKTERAMANFGAALPVGSKVQLGIRFGGKLTGSLLGVRSLVPQLHFAHSHGLLSSTTIVLTK